MHLADAFIQSDLHCIQVTVSTFYQLLLSLGKFIITMKALNVLQRNAVIFQIITIKNLQ